MQNTPIPFIHFRAQSSYSMLESAIKIEKLVELAKVNDMPAVCLADRGNLFGSLEFAIHAIKHGIQPIHGTIINLAYNSNELAEILIIAQNEAGYSNLLKLVSYSFIRNPRDVAPHITWEDLVEHNSGLIALSCYTEGITGKYLLAGDIDNATLWSEKLQKLFGDRLYFEIMRHNLDKEKAIESSYLNIANQLGISVLATNNVLFADLSMYDAHDVLLCIAGGVTREHTNRRRVSNQCYFKSAKEMVELFADLPSAIENSYYLAQRCHIVAPTSDPMLPSFSEDNTSEEQILRSQATEGLKDRLLAKFPDNLRDSLLEQYPHYFARLDYELGIICNMNFSGYFLIVSDFIRWSKEQDIAVGPGRGSGAGSIVAWCLLITDLDPIEFGLLFERFLNPERISMPDFDIDFCQERREEVINYVRNKYGNDRVGQIITFGKMQAKAVIKDVSRVLALPYSLADHLTELVPFNAVNPVTLEQAIADVSELKSAYQGKGLYNLSGENELIQQVLTTSLALEGLHRHTSIHAAGVIIAKHKLIETVPLYKDNSSDMLIVQYSMKYAELAGLMKFDFLGLQTLTLISRCQKLLTDRGKDIDLNNLSYNDLNTYKMLSTGAGTGVFQFESSGMKDTLKRLKPDCIQDIIALGALYRPGPMENIPIYIACKHGKQQPDYLDPLLIPILKETHGVIIYQEQVLEIAKILAGYSLGAADLLRRAMGKKIKSEMQAQEELFVKGAEKNGIDSSKARLIFATVAKFAGYGFNKAHASAYGVISYTTAYLKANYLLEFLVSCLNLELDNNDKINLFLQEARNNSVEIMPPDINQSFGHFSIFEDKAILYGFGAIKGVTANLGITIAQIREKQKFTSIIDFIERMPSKAINRRTIESLIKAGCFDSLHDNRNHLLANINNILSYSTTYHTEQTTKQISLLSVKADSKIILKNQAGSELPSLALQEFEVLGLFIKHHPLQDYLELLNLNTCPNSKSILQLADGVHHIKIAGVIQKKDSRMSERGRFIVIQLSDLFGIFDITIYSEEVVKNYAEFLEVKTIVIATCDLVKDAGGIKLTAREFHSIEDIGKDKVAQCHLIAQNEQDLNDIIKLINNDKNTKPKDLQLNCSVFLTSKINDCFNIKLGLTKQITLSKKTLEKLELYYIK